MIGQKERKIREKKKQQKGYEKQNLFSKQKRKKKPKRTCRNISFVWLFIMSLLLHLNTQFYLPLIDSFCVSLLLTHQNHQATSSGVNMNRYRQPLQHSGPESTEAMAAVWWCRCGQREDIRRPTRPPKQNSKPFSFLFSSPRLRSSSFDFPNFNLFLLLLSLWLLFRHSATH